MPPLSGYSVRIPLWRPTYLHPKSIRWEAQFFQEISSPGGDGRAQVSSGKDERKSGRYGGVNKRIHYAVEELFQKADKSQAARIGVVDWIVGAVSIEIHRLRTAKTGRLHPDWINLGEAALLRVIVAVEGVVEACDCAAIVGGESFIR